MRFVIDENLSQELVERLQQLGHEVLSITNLQPGLKNGAVLTYAWQQQAILITSDKSDFGELIFRFWTALPRTNRSSVATRFATSTKSRDSG